MCCAAAATAVMALGVTVQAQCAEPYPSDTQQPDYTALLTDFTNYYQPDLTAPSTELRGRVVNAEVLKENSDATVSVNHKANEGRTSDDDPLNPQQQRALKDSDLLIENTYSDALGPVLGRFLSEGIKQGDLPLSTTLLVKRPGESDIGTERHALLSRYVNDSAVKKQYVHPRPFTDRTNGGYVAAGLPKTEEYHPSAGVDGRFRHAAQPRAMTRSPPLVRSLPVTPPSPIPAVSAWPRCCPSSRRRS